MWCLETRGGMIQWSRRLSWRLKYSTGLTGEGWPLSHWPLLESQPALNGHPLGLAHGYHWVSREVAHSATSPFFSGLMSVCLCPPLQTVTPIARPPKGS